jgi:small subunit ribosomal protein S6
MAGFQDKNQESIESTMAVNVYECMFLLDTNKVAGNVPDAAKQIHAILEKNQVEMLASRPWDERRLCFPISGQKKGLYYLTYFRTESKNLLNIERDVALNETILRSLVLRIDPKHVETMLAIARDEHALALQVAPEGGIDDITGESYGGDSPRGGRRGGRRAMQEDRVD